MIRSIAPGSANAAASVVGAGLELAEDVVGERGAVEQRLGLLRLRTVDQQRGHPLRPRATCTTRSRTFQPSHGVGRSQSPGADRAEATTELVTRTSRAVS